MATIRKPRSIQTVPAATTTLELSPSGETPVVIGTPVDVTVTTNATDFTVESGTEANATVQKGDGKFTITGVAAGDSIITVKATADGGEEVTATITAKVAAAPSKPSAPVMTEPGNKEVNEGEKLTIAFNSVEGGTLNATVEGGDTNGTVVVKGFNVEYTAPSVDGDKNVVLHVTLTKDSQTSTSTDVNVKVKNVPEVTTPTELTLTPADNASVVVGQTTEVQVATNASSYTIEGNDESKLDIDKQANKFILTGKQAGSVSLKVKAKADNHTETVKTLNVSITAAAQQKPAAPVLVRDQTLEVNENSSLDIKFTIEEGSTLEATVENSNGIAKFKAGSTNTEGIITYTSKEVDGDTNVKLTVKAKKSEVASDPLEMTVKVKDVPAATVTTLDVQPAEVEVAETAKGTFTVTTNASDFAIDDKNQAIYKATKKGNKIEVVGLRGGAAFLKVEAQADGGEKVTKQVVVSVISSDAPETILTVDPAGPLTLKEGAKQVFDVDTNSDLGVTLSSDNEDSVTADTSSRTIKAVKEGKANITITAKAGLAAAKSVVVEVTVTKEADPEPEPDPKLTDEEIKGILEKPDFNYKTDIVELGKNAPLKYTTELSVIKTYVNKMATTSNLISEYDMSAQSYNLYYVITDILDDVKAEEVKFNNLLNIVSKMFFQYKDVATSKRHLVRGIDKWATIGFTKDAKDVYTFEALFGLIALLSDEAKRNENKATVKFDEMFAEDKVNLDATFIAALKKFYKF